MLEVKNMEKEQDGKEAQPETTSLSGQEFDDPTILKVSSKTSAKDLFPAIIRTYQKHGYVKVRAIGGGAIKNAYEAIVIARSKLITFDQDIIIIPNAFFAKMPDGKNLPGALMVLENR